MTLEQWIENNKNKEIKFEDGKITVIKPEKPEGVWMPKSWEEYFFLWGDGSVSSHNYNSDNEWDEDCLAIGNCFKTEAEAMRAVEIMKIMHELRVQGGREFIPDKPNWTFHFDNTQHYIYFERYVCFSHPLGIYFNSNDKVQKAVEAVGEDRIKKYIFGVED